jgi:uncharacterized phage-like protein YoqJ
VIIAGTGHRKLGGSFDLKGPVARSVRKVVLGFLEDRRPDQVISGMALGFDTILALAAIELDIPVLAAIPFAGQESRWPEESQARYRLILGHPIVESWVVAPGCFNAFKLQHRNERMSDRCDLLLSCFDDSLGGTKNCVDYALSIGKPVLRFRPGSSEIERLALLAPG